MKEFEKWWENNHPIYDTGNDTIGHYNEAKKSWREALECMLAQETVKPLLGGSEHRYVDSIIIRKELEE